MIFTIGKQNKAGKFEFTTYNNEHDLMLYVNKRFAEGATFKIMSATTYEMGIMETEGTKPTNWRG